MGVTKLILRYNAMAGRDPFPRIQELTTQLKLEIEEVREEAPAAGKRLMVVRIRGSLQGLSHMENELFRIPSVTSKLVEH